MALDDQIFRQKKQSGIAMNVQHILTNFIHAVTPSMHSARRKALQNIVLSASTQQQLTVTSLGRNLDTQAYEKHRIKSADRLLSNTQLFYELPHIYQQLARYFAGYQAQPVILVDWSDLEPGQQFFLLRAALACEGRSITLYEEVHSLATKDKPQTHQQFLRRLHAILPASCKPVIVTDAGFRGPWFRQVLDIGWDYVGRVRNQTNYRLTPLPWQRCTSLYPRATKRAQWFNHVELAKERPLITNFVLFKDKAKGRRVYNRKGERNQSNRNELAAKSWKEPWLLATSLAVTHQGQANGIVKRYQARMQIEESFRDMKSVRFGFGMSMHNTKKMTRLAIMVMISTLAGLYLYLIGLLGRVAGFARYFQANTVRDTFVMSCLSLGRRLLARCFDVIDELMEGIDVFERLRQHTLEYAVRWEP